MAQSVAELVTSQPDFAGGRQKVMSWVRVEICRSPVGAAGCTWPASLANHHRVLPELAHSQRCRLRSYDEVWSFMYGGVPAADPVEACFDDSLVSGVVDDLDSIRCGRK